MKKINLVATLLLLFSSFITISCKDNIEEKERKYLRNYIEELKVEKQYMWIVIIPGAGCNGCILDAEHFMKENLNNKQILFILTRTTSIKILQQKLGILLGEYSNIYLDKENNIEIPTKNLIYPCVIKLDNGKYIKHAFQSPQSYAFGELKKQYE